MPFEYGQALIRFKCWQYRYLNIDLYFSRLFTIEHLSMAASDNILGEKQYVIFRKILATSEKLVYADKY